MSLISIYDLKGTKVMEYRDNASETLLVDVSGIGEGLYLVRITGDDGSESTGKFLIRR